jgi:hypothetical protein
MIPAFDLAPKSIPDRDSTLKLIDFVSINDPSSSGSS